MASNQLTFTAFSDTRLYPQQALLVFSDGKDDQASTVSVPFNHPRLSPSHRRRDTLPRVPPRTFSACPYKLDTVPHHRLLIPFQSFQIPLALNCICLRREALFPFTKLCHFCSGIVAPYARSVVKQPLPLSGQPTLESYGGVDPLS